MTSRAALADLPAKFDLIIIGGGITGAGILREAVRTGAKVLLAEQNDFASGTSSASSKLVHGGLRYLKTGQWRLTLESVRERQRLLDEAPGLVEAQPFLIPIYRGARPGKLAMQIGLWIYDRMASASHSRWLNASEALKLEPQLRQEQLLGAMLYEDAQTDDARLVLRLVLESVSGGAIARNYTRIETLLHSNGRVSGVAVRDELSGETKELQAGVVINATGAWAGTLAGTPAAAPSASAGDSNSFSMTPAAAPGASAGDHNSFPMTPAGAPKLRPLRGSHFVFPLSKLPIGRAVSWLHPRDHRPIFAYPWESAVVYGTTDLDHREGEPPRMSTVESEYLLEGLEHQFPGLKLNAKDATSTYAGVRPVVASGKDNDPSDESRESAQWSAPGLVGITGGKLTTFRVTARQALQEAAKQVPALAPVKVSPVFTAMEAPQNQHRIFGRLGTAAGRYQSEMPDAEKKPIAGTPYSLAELRWAARHESVVHLDDLLMRRTRLGLVAPEGGRALLPQLRPICQAEIGWDDSRWDSEQQRYQALWQQLNSPVNPA